MQRSAGWLQVGWLYGNWGLQRIMGNVKKSGFVDIFLCEGDRWAEQKQRNPIHINPMTISWPQLDTFKMTHHDLDE